MEHIEVELDNMSFGDRERLLNLLREQDTRERENKIFYRIFKDGTPLSIENYPKQKKFLIVRQGLEHLLLEIVLVRQRVCHLS